MGAISLPKYFVDEDNKLISPYDWGELSAQQFHQLLPLQRKVLSLEKHWTSSLWEQLKFENTPLRAILNSRLFSVPEDFYDNFIAENLPDSEFLMGKLIGNILGK